MAKRNSRRGHAKRPKAPAKRKVKLNSKAELDKLDEIVPTQLDKSTVEGREPVDRRGDNGKLLLDPHHSRLDIQLINRAQKEHWPVRRKQMIVTRLEEIVAKTEAEVVTKDGVVSLESAGDKLSIEAARVLAAMDGVNLRREEVIAKIEESKPADKPNMVINVQDNSTTFNGSAVDDRRVSLLRLAQRIGASELVIDGECIRPGELPESASPLPPS